MIICACVFISLGIYSYWRRREKEIKNQKEILEQTIEKQRQNNLRIKEENRQQIEKLQEQLIAMEKSDKKDGKVNSSCKRREYWKFIMKV